VRQNEQQKPKPDSKNRQTQIEQQKPDSCLDVRKWVGVPMNNGFRVVGDMNLGFLMYDYKTVVILVKEELLGQKVTEEIG
jgi:hypothetical protein